MSGVTSASVKISLREVRVGAHAEARVFESGRGRVAQQRIQAIVDQRVLAAFRVGASTEQIADALGADVPAVRARHRRATSGR